MRLINCCCLLLYASIMVMFQLKYGSSRYEGEILKTTYGSTLFDCSINRQKATNKQPKPSLFHPRKLKIIDMTILPDGTGLGQVVFCKQTVISFQSFIRYVCVCVAVHVIYIIKECAYVVLYLYVNVCMCGDIYIFFYYRCVCLCVRQEFPSDQH